ncbi:uncharacterized protein LOC132703314 [Cylas formicarius]|uniref:uncharacterized protein LOC132703314 n=1 Tax=Cylas formicarius TaxID=197179 RepID=UPI00295886CD|nr:uncharacterized protein LOC132703314 [Cylas formicarius]
MAHFNLFFLSVIHLVKISLQEENYIVRTDSCAIPNIPAQISEFWQYPLNSTEPMKCSVYDELLSYVTKENNVATLRLRTDLIADIYGSESALNCCYSLLYRNGTEEVPDEGVVTSQCIPFRKKVPLQHHLVWVKCNLAYAPTTLAYENIHQVITITEEVERKGRSLKTRAQPISILFVVLDGVSRLNFVRTMPETRKYILENKFYEFKGYNKVHDNTFPNFMAWLSGMNLTDSIQVCKPKEVEGLSNCPLIWNTFRRSGYATAYAEDWSSISTFNYLKKGFKYPPTDYYFKPYIDATDGLYIQYQDTMPFCTGPVSAGERILNLAEDFTRTMRGLPSFGVFWMNTFSHNNMNTTRKMDSRMKRFFETLKSDGVLDENVVIFLSDHGNRFGNLIGTPRGFFEERLPMNYISLPTWFRNKFTKESKNFQENANKLTSTYDLYVTLQHLIVLSGLDYTIKTSRACSTCQSLFQELPVDRGCPHAGIPEKWCSCIGHLKYEFLSAQDMRELEKIIQHTIDGPIKNTMELDQIVKSSYAYSIENVVESERRKNPFRGNEIVNYRLVRFVTDLFSPYQIMLSKSNSSESTRIVHIRKVY